MLPKLETIDPTEASVPELPERGGRSDSGLRPRRIAIVVALTVLAAELLTRLLAPVLPDTGHDLRDEFRTGLDRLEARADEPDTLLLGASEIAAGVDPAALDRWSETVAGAHTLWLSAVGASTIATVARDVWLTARTPERIVIGLTSREANRSDIGRQQRDQGLLRSLDYRRESGRLGLLHRLDDLAQRFSALVRHRQRLRSPQEIAQEMVGTGSAAPAALATNEFGMHTNRLDVPGFRADPVHLEQERRAMADFAVDHDGLDQLGDLVVGARARGIDVVIVELPVYERHYLALHAGLPEGDAAYRAAVRELAHRTGARYLDPRASLNWDNPALWADVNHLNRQGAAQLTAWLADALDKSTELRS